MEDQQKITLVRLPAAHTFDFKEETQEAFQKGFTSHRKDTGENEE